MKPQNRLVEFANASFGFWICFLGGVGEWGDDDDIVTQAPRTLSPEPALQYFRDVGPFYIVTNLLLDFANLILGFRMAFGKKPKLGRRKLFR